MILSGIGYFLFRNYSERTHKEILVNSIEQSTVITVIEKDNLRLIITYIDIDNRAVRINTTRKEASENWKSR